MANRFHNKMPKRKGAPTGKPEGRIPKIVEKTAAWPGVPGKTQPRDRSAGVKKVKQSMRSEGI
ncbi:hypothetical protein AMJ82_11205 [candidate division TA06 bacterium SM23_40]|uniref:Uncharacterized protein n=1 Tax=candidate division TA06 bacterium SM23_40 TaxID=1703774 RepID=A0A0S8G258_UNCT6|nr:MAG: hypothetical protein AMJ82_11205 [candidate division TA06 bacterium SM23_40]